VRWGLAILAAASLTHLTASDNVQLSIRWSEAIVADAAAPVAIVARSDSFADSLAAGALAGTLGAPVLLNPPTSGLDARVARELDRVGAELVYVVGGTGAVSVAAESDLRASGRAVERLAGTDRVRTAVAVAREIGPTPHVYLARAFGPDPARTFADSIGAGMVAGTDRVPLLLTDPASLSTSTADLLDAFDVEEVRIVGGTAAVSDRVETQLEAAGHAVARIAGADRFGTAVATARLSYSGGGLVALVDGFSANSWASGFPAAAAAEGAVVMSDGERLPSATRAWLESQAGTGAFLVCAPEVRPAACTAAANTLG